MPERLLVAADGRGARHVDACGAVAGYRAAAQTVSSGKFALCRLAAAAARTHASGALSNDGHLNGGKNGEWLPWCRGNLRFSQTSIIKYIKLCDATKAAELFNTNRTYVNQNGRRNGAGCELVPHGDVALGRQTRRGRPDRRVPNRGGGLERSTLRTGWHAWPRTSDRTARGVSRLVATPKGLYGGVRFWLIWLSGWPRLARTGETPTKAARECPRRRGAAGGWRDGADGWRAAARGGAERPPRRRGCFLFATIAVIRSYPAPVRLPATLAATVRSRSARLALTRTNIADASAPGRGGACSLSANSCGNGGCGNCVPARGENVGGAAGGAPAQAGEHGVNVRHFGGVPGVQFGVESGKL